jgi:DNA-binding transcriptional MocR family regulator
MLKYSQSRNNDVLQQYIAAQFIGSPAYDRHLRQLRTKLKIQRQLCVQAINCYFPDGTRVAVPDAGLAIWVKLPDGVSSQEVFQKAIHEQIFVAPGHMFSNSMRFDGYLRLNCGWPFTEEIEEALANLGSIVHTLKLKDLAEVRS